MDKYLKTFVEKVNGLRIYEKYKDSIYDMSETLVKETLELTAKLVTDENGYSVQQALKASSDHFCSEIAKNLTKCKRDIRYSNKPEFVPPQEKSLGSRYNKSAVKDTPTKYQGKIPDILQYIPIRETARSVLNQDDNLSKYIEYNLDKQSKGAHICQHGIYKGNCCGQVYQNNEFFKENPEAMQIHIGSDDFEVANPLGPHATVYKICAIYFTIRNMPAQYLSKPDNIYLICLCFTDDIKTKEADFNRVWRIIMKDIEYLETFGIDFEGGINIKGTLSILSFDNLGAHVALGYAESCNSRYPCRICLTHKDECKILTNPCTLEYRTIENYTKHMKVIAGLQKVDYGKTKGLRMYCALNDMEYFHTLQNQCLDVMHDLNEGCMHFLLKDLFQYCVSKKILTENELKLRISNFDYGRLDDRNVPSHLNLDKDNLNQNATQSKCLFENIPFILWNYRNNKDLKQVWVCVETLLRISQTLYSYEITEDDVNELQKDIDTHLSSFKTIFKRALKFKQHNLLHYPEYIRNMGPPIYTSMMRFEAKHKWFKDYVKMTNCYRNILKTLALNHQQQFSTKKNTYEDVTTHAEPDSLHAIKENEEKLNLEEEDYIKSIFQTADEVQKINWLEFNSYKYGEGLKVLHNSSVYGIRKIFYVESKVYFFLIKFNYMGFDSFSNSLKLILSEPPEYIILPFQKLLSERPYESHVIENKCFLKATNLDVKNIYNR